MGSSGASWPTRSIFVLFVFSFCAAPDRGQEIQLKAGIVDHQVLQRNADNSADLRLSGSAQVPDGRQVEARILSNGVEIERFSWFSIATSERDQWAGEIKRIPTGGPYRLELRLVGASRALGIDDILVGDLWVLGGQSNMSGEGEIESREPPSPLVHSFDLTDRWVVAQEPLHRFIDAVDPVHHPGKPRVSGAELWQAIVSTRLGVGPGLPFAVDMVRRTGVPVGLIPCAHPGTLMDDWDPALKEKGGDSLYGSMLRRVRAVGNKITGMLWYQGEGEAWPDRAPTYKRKLETFVASVRADFGQPRLPFYYVQLGRYPNYDPGRNAWNYIQDAQRQAEKDLQPSGMVAAVDAEMVDYIHLSARGQRTVAHRLANLACRDLVPNVASCHDLKRGPRPGSITLTRTGSRGGFEFLIRVQFTDVNGSLRIDGQDGRVAGFTVHLPTGEPIPLIFKSQIDAREPNVVLLDIETDSLPDGRLPPGSTLRYGYGNDPFCNVVDQQDMAIPVFGPLPIEQ